MVDGARAAIRAARRSDLHALVDLRMRFLGEAAHGEPRLRLLPDARARTEHTLPVWMGHDERVLLVATEALREGAETAGEDGQGSALVGYAMGLLNAVPPVLRHQQVGEILEVWVEPAQRGQGVGRALLQVLTEALIGRGAEVLRAAVPVAQGGARERLEAGGYRALQYVLERPLDAG